MADQPTAAARIQQAGMQSEFRGPLFIVGLPRSGTKLIRDLLNGSPNVGIPVEESHFIPYLLARYPAGPRLDESGWREAFWIELEKIPFMINYARVGRRMPMEVLLEPTLAADWPEVFRRILTFFAPPSRAANFVWGDKTPGYLRHLTLLRELFPMGHVLHIIRDPREYALSVHYAWGKSVLRAAAAWRMELERGRMAARELGDDYVEVRYEDLTSNPEGTLRSVCAALRIPFEPEMLQMTSPSENLGRARGVVGILAGNTQKYLKEMSSETIQRIEELVYPLAIELGYPIHFASAERPLGRGQQTLLRYQDGLASLRFHVRDRGVRAGSEYFFRRHRTSSWHVDAENKTDEEAN